MIDPSRAGVSEEQWTEATAGCVPLRVARVVEETHDSRSIVFEIPPEERDRFAYRAGQFLSFKVPHQGVVLTRSYSLSSSPDVDAEHKITVKRVDEGRVSNWLNDSVEAGDVLPVVPPAGLFVLNDETRKVVLFGGGSGITPIISLIKTALATTERELKLVYANRDERSIIFRDELDELARRHPGRLEIVHSLDDADGFLDLHRVRTLVHRDIHSDFYLCGPGVFMAVVEEALRELRVDPSQIHIERFVSPPDPGQAEEAPAAAAVAGDAAPSSITVVLDGEEHEVPYQAGEKVLQAARTAGLDPPFSCEEGYCSCCMAKLIEGEVKMDTNDCLTPELLEEGWVLTCQSRCASGKIRIEYPD